MKFHHERGRYLGTLVAAEVSPEAILPRSLSLLIQDALKNQPSGPVTATLANQEGRLDSDSSRETSWSQPLSDWVLEIVVDGDNLNFKLSAALLAIGPFWQKRTGNHWLISDQVSPRLQIEFRLDLATRIAVFGTRLSGSIEESASDRPHVHKTTAANPRLDNAPVGSNGEVFGFATDGSWINIFEGLRDSKVIALERYNPQKRLSNGFISVAPGHKWPRIWLRGLDMDRIIELVLRDGRRGSVEFKDGFFGELQGHHGDEEPMIGIGSVAIDLHLTALGLEFSYSLNRLKSQKQSQFASEAGPWSGSFIIAWEILILRYPRLAIYRLVTLR